MAEATTRDFVPHTIADLVPPGEGEDPNTPYYKKFGDLPMDEKIDLIRTLAKNDSAYRKLDDATKTQLFHMIIPPKDFPTPPGEIQTGQELRAQPARGALEMAPPPAEQPGVPPIFKGTQEAAYQLQQMTRAPAESPIGPQTTSEATRPARIALAGAAGQFGDILNVPGAISGALGGPTYHIPVGTEDIAKALGVPSETMTAWEKVLQMTAGAVGPGVLLRTASQVGILPKVAQKLLPYMSAGPIGDIAMGAAAGVGTQIGEAITPTRPGVGAAIGGIVGPLTIAGLHGAISAGTKTLGRKIAKLQDVAEAEVESEVARAGVRTARQEAARIKLEGQQRITEAARTGEALATGAETGAETGARAATTEVAGTFAPLEETLMQSVLKPTPTPSLGAEALAPGVRAVGKAALAEIKEIEKRIPLQAGAEGAKLIESLGPRMDRMATLATAKAGFQKFYETGRKQIGELFDATEQVTGDVSVVNLKNFKDAAKTIIEEVGQTGQAAPRGAVTMTRLGLPTEEVDALLNADPKFARLSPTEKKAALRILGPEEYAGEGEELIPFWLARRVESSLSRIAYEGAKPIGTMTQGMARKMLTGLQEDLHAFYASPEATTRSADIEAALTALGKEGGTVAEALPLAKEQYGKFIQTVNRSIVRKVLSRDPQVVEQFLAPFTSTSGATVPLITIKENASPDVWNTLKAFTLGDLHRKASASGQFDIGDMQGYLKGLRRSGKMDILFDPEEIASIERYANKLATADTGYLPQFRSALARKEPSEVVSFAFEPGKIEHTQNFKAVVSPETYDASVKAWAANVVEELPDITPDKLYAKLKPFVARDRNAPSQLDIMLTEYPGLSDTLTNMVEQYPTKLRAAESATRHIGEAKAKAAEELAGVRERARLERMQAAKAVESAKDLATSAREKEQKLRRLAGIEPDLTTNSYLRLGGVHLRASGQFVLGAAMAEVAGTLLTGHPLWALAGVGIVGTQLGFKAFAATEAGRRVIREGLSRHYAPSTARWALQALGHAEEPENAPSAAPSTAP